ncbi:polysaccharide biosynthesis protein [Porphyromonas gulae]|uniref:lipopolysaccharide biosynthesis protein n=1 Tax=Porphyromonas gulae TaxID=111105 RepID=UPI00052C0730|nr:lipopolysaccharide biosynthesis protein [Porphyromonas gulae]KGO03156.1 polysaccharide biosynthesis protein [Porphyromonas gulae]
MIKEEGRSSLKQGQSSMTANSMKLISAGTFVQVLAFLLLPVIGRIYTESEIGQITVFLSVVGVLTIVATGRYDQATILARSKERALLLLFTSLRFNLIFCLALIPVVLIINPFLTDSRYSGQQTHLFLLPLFVFFAAGVISLLSWANSHNQYGRMSIAQISQGLGNNLLRIGFGLLKMGFWGLQLAALLGGMAGILPLVRKQALLSQYKRYVTCQRLRIAARTYANFPRYSLPQAVIDILSGSLVSLLLPLQYHDAAVGLYGMAYMLAGRPMQLISDSLSRVWFRRVAEQKNAGLSFILPIRRFVLIWLLVAVLGSILLFFFLEPLVVVILGEKWLLCSSIIMAMLPFFIFNFLSSVYNFLPDLFGKQRKFMKMQAILLVVQLLVILTGTRLLPFEKYMWLHFAERALDSFVQIAWFYMIIRKYENSLRLHSCAPKERY